MFVEDKQTNRKDSDVSAYTLKHFIQKKYTPVMNSQGNQVNQKEIWKKIREKKKLIEKQIEMLDNELLNSEIKAMGKVF